MKTSSELSEQKPTLETRKAQVLKCVDDFKNCVGDINNMELRETMFEKRRTILPEARPLRGLDFHTGVTDTQIHVAVGRVLFERLRVAVRSIEQSLD